jgi:hypothetical protein
MPSGPTMRALVNERFQAVDGICRRQVNRSTWESVSIISSYVNFS